MDQPTKSFNTKGGKNRLRFASAKFRAKSASADVYRSSDNRRTASSTGLREKRVHDTSFRSGDGEHKRRRKDEKGKQAMQDDVRYFGRDNDAEGLGIGRTAVIVSSKSKLQLEETGKFGTADEELKGSVGQKIGDVSLEQEEVDQEFQTADLILGGTIFLTELEISAQRNGSQLYQKLVQELRPLCKSLAELLHHGERIVNLLYAYLLSPRGMKNDNVSSPTPPRRLNDESWKSYKNELSEKVAPYGYSVNTATNEVLHLFGVLARELRTEIYPYLTTRILPRIIDDMLNPPIVSTVESSDNHTLVPVDVSHIEAAFRTVSYLFKYNSDKLLHSHLSNHLSGDEGTSMKQQQAVGDADILRQFYGKTICHKRDIVRRLACEAYAPLLRKCSEKGLKRHLSRTVKALACSLAVAPVTENENEISEGEPDGTYNHMPSSAKRARADAIDGVSSLLFEVSRGAPGRLHSKKGRLVAKTIMDCIICYGKQNTTKNGNRESYDAQQLLALEKSKAFAVYEVASQFLYKLRGHVARRSQEEGHDMAGNAFADILDEMHRALEQTTSMMKELSTPLSSREITDCVSRHVIDLMTETIIFQDGRLLSNGFDRCGAADRVADSLQELLSHSIYSNAGPKLQEHILRYLCSAWRKNPGHSSFALRLGKFFPSIISRVDAYAESPETGLDPALFLGQNLLPYLPKKVASTYLIPALLGATASSYEKLGDSSLVLLHTISTAVWPTTDTESVNDVDIDDAAAEALFTWEAAEHCPEIPSKVLRSLFDICLTKDLESLSKRGTKKSKVDQAHVSNHLARVGYISRCIPFLVCLKLTGNDEDRDEDSYTEGPIVAALNWYSSVLKNLNAKIEDYMGINHEFFIAQSLVLESLSKSIIECHKRVSSPKISSMMNKILGKAKTYASSLLFHQPKSIWVVRGVAAVTSALSIIDPGSSLNDRSNETFELLVPNLAEPSHFLRLYTLRVLESYPVRPFVADHADLDLTDDLEEEPSYRPQPSDQGEISNDNVSSSSLLSGACDVISLLMILESIPVALPNERKLTSVLTRIEVYARTGKLPIVYAEAVICHMLGFLHVKFAPIWPAAVKVIVSITSAQEGPAWPFVEVALNRSMEKPSIIEDTSADQKVIITARDHPCHIGIIAHHHSLCVAWEMSKGMKNDIFRPLNEERNAQVSRHVVTDELTLFESIWSILENAPQLTSTKSKAVVPIFFDFLVSQYFVFHQDEPDSREIDWTDIAKSHDPKWLKEELSRKTLQKKLESFLRVFAAVKGPQQLFKHKVLLQIFVSFLANPDGRLSNLAFSCVLRFKLPYLSPYVDYVQPMLKREGLREALTKFDISEDSEIVDAEHRLLLLPIVIRILFGRFSARGNGVKKSAKDSPTARRAAILSFFSGIGNNEGELNYFIYMMIRAFIPRNTSMTNEGIQIEKEALTRLIQASEKITSTEVTYIPLKRQEGFLNLLTDVITQIGFGVKDFVPTFTNLLLAISEQTEHALVANIKNQAIKNEPYYDGSTSVEHDGKTGIGRIRTLTFLRLADIMTKFASSIDFSVHVEHLWKSTSSSVVALPNTVINAEKPPSSLQLIEAISSHHALIPLLHQSESAVVAVFKCIAGTTRMNVMNCVLRIIGGLLTDGGTLGTLDERHVSCNAHTMGHTIILQNIHMLIAQFTDRLTSISKNAHLDEEVDISRRFSTKSPRKPNPTDGLQLNILCRVTELLVSATEANEEHIATMETLCNLLVPLLKFDSHPNQLYVMRTVNSLIPKLSNTQASMSHFHAISKLLGPNRNNAGITLKEHRNAISLAISAICSREFGCPKWKLVAQAVADLNAASTSYVDEHDFEKMLPVLNGLGGDNQSQGSWLALSTDERDELQQMTNESKTFDGTRMLLPLIYTCFHMLYDPDGVISRSSNKALKCLVTTCSESALSNMHGKVDLHQNRWVKLIETTVVPCLKIGITTKHLATRRIFILLLSHVARHFVGCSSVHLYGDLRCLIRDDDQELDFFLNVTHVQLHRRARAFNRLRKVLCAHAGQLPLFSDQSFGNILLPLAMHPVYECNSKDEESYVIEAIATVGEISKHLPWSKYNSTLQSVLNNLGRYPDQERFLIAMLCAIIDAFHFSVETGEDTSVYKEDQAQQSSQGNGVWRSLNNRIIPKVESFLIREKVDKHGSKNKSLRSSVVLALMKLFQKLPVSIFESKLPKLITCVCNALKNKDSNERDTARDTLSKMAVSLDTKYLPLILSELSVSLSEGYKLHVRSATLHSILVAISKVQQETDESTEGVITLSLFDRCVPAMLDLIHQDIFGKASEIKDQAGHEKRLIKEAMGSKSLDSLETISKMIHFKPSLATSILKENIPGLTHASVVHAIVTPFLDRLRDPDVSSSTMRKVKDCLNRVAVGFSNNSTATYGEVLPFVYATVSPFVFGKIKRTSEEDADLEDSDDEVEAPIQVSKSSQSNLSGGDSVRNAEKQALKTVPVATWTPTHIGAAGSQKAALDMKKNQKKALHKVIDGAAAPKMTGSWRHSPMKSFAVKTLNNPANACAVSFGLTLLNSSLKRSKLDVSDDKLCAMADPYLSLLTHCVSFSSDNQAVLLSLRCLGIFLRMDLPSVFKSAKALGPSILDHLTAAGAASNTQSDIVQGCFKTLTLLISHQKFASSITQNSTTAFFKDAHVQSNHNETLPLTTDQMQALISLLHTAVRENDHHNSTFGLVKAISSKRYVSSEFYDLMDITLKLIVQSQKSAIRLLSSQIFLQYLLEYPMGTQRMDSHLNQIVLNIKYEYEEGRLAAIYLFSSVIQKLPLPILELRCQFFFLPLVLQLVNDDSKTCKEAVADCISLLLQRLSTESAQSLFVYAKRWSQSSGAHSLPMQRASAQLLGIFVDSRPDYVKRGSNATDIVSIIQEVVTKQDLEDESEWELLYHNLICTEKLQKRMPALLRLNYELWGTLVNLMAYPHPWVMQVSSRIISSHLNEIDPNRLMHDAPESFIVNIPGCLYKIARNSCRQLDAEDVHFVEATSTIAIKAIAWAFRAMKQHQNICYNVSHGNDEESDGEVALSQKSKDPCLWVMTRLSNIAKPKGNHRRASVFKCFAALCTSCDPQHLSPYLELMIDPIDRAIREATNKLGPDDEPENNPQIALPKDVLQILEDTCGTEPFVKAFAEVNRKAREKRDKRKQDVASEAVHDPAAAAQRKIMKQVREKERKKRNIEDRRSQRGGSKKRRG